MSLGSEPTSSSAGGVPTPSPVSDLDWDPAAAREFGEGLLAVWQELLTELPRLPIGRREGPDAVRQAVALDVPDAPMDPAALVDYLRSIALDHSVYPGHPGFMAYISGAGTVPGAAADAFAAALNQNLGGWMLSPAATEIERLVISWLGRQIGLGPTVGGTVTSGGATATLTALKVARDRAAGLDVRAAGLAAGPPLVVYASDQAHVVVDRAADLLGLGTDAVRHVPTDADYRMDVSALGALIAEDRASGLRPMAVVGTAGTTATGSIDPLAALADLCEVEKVWFHVDGAYGAPAVIVPELRPLFAGIERADSVALDPHKWLYVPLAVGCVLVRDPSTLRDSFAVDASYLQQDREHVERGDDFSNEGIQFSRGFPALKVWVSLLAHGRDAYARRIAHDVELARYLHDQVRLRPCLEAIGDVTLSIACFRYVPDDLATVEGTADTEPDRDAYLSRLNERVMTELQSDGRAYCSNAVLDGRFVLRACIVNFRTEAPDVDRLLDVAVELGDRIDAELRPS